MKTTKATGWRQSSPPTSAAALLTEANRLSLSTMAHSMHAPLLYASIIITLAHRAHHHKSKDFSISTSTKVLWIPVLSRMAHTTCASSAPPGMGHVIFACSLCFRFISSTSIKGFYGSAIQPIIHFSTLSLAVAEH